MGQTSCPFGLVCGPDSAELVAPPSCSSSWRPSHLLRWSARHYFGQRRASWILDPTNLLMTTPLIPSLIPHRRARELNSQPGALLATRAAGAFSGCCSQKGVSGRHLNPLAVPNVPSYDRHCLRSLKLSRGLGARAGRRKPIRDLDGPSNPRHHGHHREPRIGAAEPITTRPLRRCHRLKHYCSLAVVHLGCFLGP